MKKMMTGWAAAAILASAGSLVAHHSLTQFDTTKSVTVRGTVRMFARVNPHSFIFIEEKTEDGETHRWAIEGPTINLLARRGIEKDALKPGDVIEACGYVLKEGVDSRRTMERISSTLGAVSGQLLDAEVLVMPDGTKQIWSDYGVHKCLAPDYKDFHAR